MDELGGYLEGVDPAKADQFLRTGTWPEDVQIPKDASVLGADGRVDFEHLAPEGGYTLDAAGQAIKHPYVPQIGDHIDRYGPPDGRYTSPIPDGGPYQYDERSLPYIEDPGQYHQYEITGDVRDVRASYDRAPLEVREDVDSYMSDKGLSWNDLVTQEGDVAPAFSGSGGGSQIEFPLPVEYLEALHILKEIG
jgi:hypothetical protein